MLKPGCTHDLTELANKLQELRRLKVKLQTERDMIIKRRSVIQEKLRIVNIPDNLTEYVEKLTKTLTDDINGVVIPEEIENELRDLRNSGE